MGRFQWFLYITGVLIYGTNYVHTKVYIKLVYIIIDNMVNLIIKSMINTRYCLLWSKMTQDYVVAGTQERAFAIYFIFREKESTVYSQI